MTQRNREEQFTTDFKARHDVLVKEIAVKYNNVVSASDLVHEVMLRLADIKILGMCIETMGTVLPDNAVRQVGQDVCKAVSLALDKIGSGDNSIM